MNTPDPMAGWLPFALTARGGQAGVEWGYMGTDRFVEPFFSDTLQSQLDRPFNQVFRRYSDLSYLLARAQQYPGLPVHGLIFHSSRCGSTLIAQSLAALTDSIVLSEPEPFDTLLQWLIADPNSAAISSTALQAIISALGQARRSEDRRVFIKVECWHVYHIERILAAFPGVPWIFLYRDPTEVMVSQMQNTAPYFTAGSTIQHGLGIPLELTQQPLDYMAFMISHLFSSAACAFEQRPNGLLVNYQELPSVLESRIADHFNLNLTVADLESIHRVTLRDSKSPKQSFASDTQAKRTAGADPIIQAAVARWLDAPYSALEKLRGG